MNDFLKRVWLDNPIGNYLAVAAVIIFVLLLKRIISRYFAGLLFRLVHRVWKDLDKRSFVSLVVRPLGFFLLILVAIVSFHKLKFPDILNVEVYTFTLKEIVHALATIILIVSFIGLLLRIIDFIAMILEKKANLTVDQSDNQLIIFFKDFFKVIIVIIGIMMVLSNAFKLNIGSLLTGLSIVGAAIALALRESIENLIASFIIFFDKPFTTGDQVKVQQVTGSVERIGLRSTRIRTDQKTYVTVPNKQMVDSIMDNLSLRTQRRGDLRLELAVNTPTEKLEILVTEIRGIVGRKEIEDANVSLSEITTSSVILLADYYTAPITASEFNSIRQDINLQSLKLLEKMEINISGASTALKITREGK
ncbi:MAG TPA: mechanosensitive ion channel domain-containing protein [Chitinophagaceae bacterium]|nr:mechanosensitive ion channel domain-containing protein [Chitinophagaceae bacterium]